MWLWLASQELGLASKHRARHSSARALPACTGRRRMGALSWRAKRSESSSQARRHSQGSLPPLPASRTSPACKGRKRRVGHQQSAGGPHGQVEHRLSTVGISGLNHLFAGCTLHAHAAVLHSREPPATPPHHATRDGAVEGCGRGHDAAVKLTAHVLLAARAKAETHLGTGATCSLPGTRQQFS